MSGESRKRADNRRRNYAFYRYLIRCAQTSELVKKTDTVFSELDEEIGEKERAPLLARLELEKATIAMSDEEWAALVERYWTRWGSKGSMISELEGIASGNEVRLSKLEGMMKYEVTKGHVSYLDPFNTPAYTHRRTKTVIGN